MKTNIIYFTGTGNSLSIARLLAAKLPQADVISVNEMLHESIPLIKTDACGFVFPVYCQDMPEIVKRLVKKLKFDRDTYIFAVATHNGDPGYSHFTLDRLLKKKGQCLKAGFAVLMPGNSINPYNMNNETEVGQRLMMAASNVEKISSCIANRDFLPFEGSNSIRKRLKGLRNKARFKFKYRVHKKFWVTTACNLCGICARICPENNITIGSDSVLWGNHCQMCFACIHWCPQQAIQNGANTINRKRYHHPDITVNDMIVRN